jgi:hypothetical protein
MRFILGIAVLLAYGAIAVAEQKGAPPSQEQLAEITERGRLLAEYDQAAWHATDAVIAINPRKDDRSRFACRKENKWTCVFGHLGADKFLIDYEAVQGASPEKFEVQHHEPPSEDTGFYFAAVKAMLLAGKDFQATAENRPYNPSAIPAAAGQFYVYLVPAQTKAGIYPLGGDARYLVTADGNTIVEKRQFHKSILETSPVGPNGQKVVMGVYIHVLSDGPEDTDVFYVLTREPLIPEMIGAGKLKYTSGNEWHD